jgi:hypothetical protein
MPSWYLTVGAPLVLVLGTMIQFLVMPLVTTTSGVGRVVQPISDFPAYKCHKVIHSLLEGCEDLHLDEKDRRLYAACADPESRTAYQPT